jgi:hypothetical protein
LCSNSNFYGCGGLDVRQSLKKTPEWDRAYISITAKKEVVAIPLRFQKPMKFKAASNELELNRQSKLLIYEGSDRGLGRK